MYFVLPQVSALKLGDDATESKLIVDPRLPPSDRPNLLDMAHKMSGVRHGDVDAQAVSKVSLLY